MWDSFDVLQSKGSVIAKREAFLHYKMGQLIFQRGAVNLLQNGEIAITKKNGYYQFGQIYTKVGQIYKVKQYTFVILGRIETNAVW